MKSSIKISLAAAITSAITLALAGNPSAVNAASKERCYGVSKAGENACGNAAGTHSCAGQAKIDYDGGEWKMVPEGTCTKIGGKLKPFEGVNKDSNINKSS